VVSEPKVGKISHVETWVVSCDGRVGLPSWVRCVTEEIVGLVPHQKLIVGAEHGCHVMEELSSMCDGGDCLLD
jgi:hypothetical protein